MILNMENDENKERKNRDNLIEEYQGFVLKIVKRQLERLNLPASLFEELASAGYLGLVEAAERFNPESGASFKSWAYIRIKGSIIDSLREQHLSRKSYQYSKALKAANNLDESVIKEKSGQLSLNQVLNHLAEGAIAFKLSFSEICQSELPSSTSDTPEILLSKKEKRELFLNLLSFLSEKELLIIKSYYLDDKSFTQISADNPELSKSWISKIHKKALKKLKEALLTEEYKNVF